MMGYKGILALLLALHIGAGVLSTPLHQMPSEDSRMAEEWEWEEREREREGKGERGERCLGMLGSTRGAVQGLIGDGAKGKTPAERLQEFRNRVEAVRSLVVPPGLRRTQNIQSSPPSSGTGLPMFGQPSSGAGVPLLGQPTSSGTGLSQLGQPSGTDHSLLGQPSSSGTGLPQFGQPAGTDHSFLGQPSSSGAGLSQIGQPSGAGHSLFGLPQLGQPSGTSHSLLGQPSSSRTGPILGQPSEAQLPVLTPAQKTLADIRAALAPPAGAKTSLPVSPFSNKQMAAALSVPEGIMKNTADILGVTRERLVGETPENEGILGSVHMPSHTPADADVGEAHEQPTTLADILSRAHPAESAVSADENKQAENPHKILPESMVPYIPQISRTLNIPGVLDRIPERESQ